MKKTIEKVCKDKNGKWTIAQTPNLPIIVWLACIVASRLTNGELSANFSTLGTIFLTIWAYLEFANGDSLFRRILGSTILIYIFVSIFS